MDPVTAFSCAGTVLQFLDSAFKFTSLAWRIYRSEEDFHESDLFRVANDLKRIVQEFPTAPEHATDEAEPSVDSTQSDGFATLAEDCKKTAEQLLETIEALMPPLDTKKRHEKIGAALAAAFRHLWKKDEIQTLQQRLERYRTHLNFHLLVSLRGYATKSYTQQQSVLQKLGAVQDDCSKIEGIATSILKFLASKLDDPSAANTTISTLEHELLGLYLRSSTGPWHSKGGTIQLSEAHRTRIEKTILGRLYFNTMKDRKARIADTYATTFQWIFDDNLGTKTSASNFTGWLRSSEKLYWITGKAGSGKSTLMKYISDSLSETPPSYEDLSEEESTAPVGQNSRCHPYLREWADGYDLIFASFYFWNSGRELQMTHVGLLRSLLHQILSQRPDIIPKVAPERWETLCLFNTCSQGWTAQELQQLLRAAVVALAGDSRVCLFIDGLDEFQGDHMVLIKLLNGIIVDNTHVKLCVASRPWVIFEDSFQFRPSLRLEDLNYPDIKLFVTTHFDEDPEFAKLRQREPEFSAELIENVISKASGVFLWVYLVVSSLLSGMRDGDRVMDLQKKLNHLPSDLKTLYQKMLQNLEPFYLEHTAQLFSIVQCAKEPLPVVLVSLADEAEEASPHSLLLDASQFQDQNLTLRLEAMSRRLNSRCKGMLEIERGFRNTTLPPKQRAFMTVQYLHRTVKDFIESASVQSFLRSNLKSRFDPHLKLCIAYATYAKNLDNIGVVGVGIGTRGLLPLCFHNAAKVSSENEQSMVRVLTDLSATTDALLGACRPNPGQQNGERELEDVLLGREPSGTTKDKDRLFMTLKCSCPLDNPAVLQALDLLKEHYPIRRRKYSFIALAVTYGVLAYVKAKAHQGCLIQRPCEHGGSVIWPLLLDAVFQTSPQPEMVECLLHQKADPNYKLQPSMETLWVQAVCMANNAFLGMESSSSMNNWRTVLNEMILFGADISQFRSGFVLDYRTRKFLETLRPTAAELEQKLRASRDRPKIWGFW